MANDKAGAGKKKKLNGRHMSAMKRARQTTRRTQKNQTWASQVKTFEKRGLTAVKSKDVEKAKVALKDFMSVVDKAVQKGPIHFKRAARRVGRLSQQIAQIHP